ncbi:MAG: DUF3006 domain-containing protein [Firmicutes bacterium]|nr:DUF3006 domain-containing protein [Bacillota bacterium]
MRLYLTVDSLEAGQAKLLIRPQEKEVLIWPLAYLPEDIREGDILSVEIARDETATSEAKQRVTSLLNRLIEKGQE